MAVGVCGGDALMMFSSWRDEDTPPGHDELKQGLVLRPIAVVVPVHVVVLIGR